MCETCNPMAAEVRLTSPVARMSRRAPRSTDNARLRSATPLPLFRREAVCAAAKSESQSSTVWRAKSAHGPSGSTSERAYASVHNTSMGRCAASDSHCHVVLKTEARSSGNSRELRRYRSSSSSVRARASRARIRPSFEPNRNSSTLGLDSMAVARGRSDRSARPYVRA